jgi:simple sugar transport system ATP-binding protein
VALEGKEYEVDNNGAKAPGALTAAVSGEDGEAAARPLLELRGISKTYGRASALNDVSFHVGRAEILGLLGDNGAGKSTLVKTMSGVVQPDSGSIVWDGEPVRLRSRQESADLGIEVIYQDAGLVNSLSIARNIFLGREPCWPGGFMRMRYMRKTAARVLDEIVAIRGIDSPDKLVGSLSGGQKQAVAIARAVHFNRSLLVLDEPTSALAARATQALFEYLRALRSQGLSSVLVTHDLFDAYRICDRFIVMSHGEVVLEAIREKTSLEELIQTVSLS